MPRTRQTARERVQDAHIAAELKALKAENFRHRNALLAPRAANARLEEARMDALAMHIDMETLERIIRRLDRTRLDIISRRVRNMVMD